MVSVALKAFLFAFDQIDAPEQLAWTLATTAQKVAHYVALAV
jgi:hypothetical protein